MSKTIVNLTPHAIVLRLPSGQDLTIPPSGVVCRLDPIEAERLDDELIPVPVYSAPEFRGVTGLPDCDGRAYVVSGLVLQWLATAPGIGRPDVYAPGTGPGDGAIRKDGQIVAVTRLICATR